VIQHFERELTATERALLESRAAALDTGHRRGPWQSLAVAFAVGAVLCAATLAASDAPAAVIVPFWAAVMTMIGLWVGLESRRGFRRQAGYLRDGLRSNKARVLRVQSAQVVEFEEVEDEGACYAFQVTGDQMLFVCGQAYYADETFPNDDFSIVEVLASNDVVVEELMMKAGARIEPERRIPAGVKARLEIPQHLDVVRGDISNLEALLPAFSE